MTRLVADIGAGLNGATLLAFGRAEGFRLFDAAGRDMPRVAARSFFAAAVSLPAFVCLHLLDWVTAGVPPHAAQGFALELAGYAIYWAGYPVASHAVVRAIGRGSLWPGYITAWNWCNAVQYMMVTVAAIPVLLGLPAWVSETAGLVAAGWACWLEWYATRTTLQLGALSAAVVTALDMAAGTFIVGLIGVLAAPG